MCVYVCIFVCVCVYVCTCMYVYMLSLSVCVCDASAMQMCRTEDNLVDLVTSLDLLGVIGI